MPARIPLGGEKQLHASSIPEIVEVFFLFLVVASLCLAHNKIGYPAGRLTNRLTFRLGFEFEFPASSKQIMQTFLGLILVTS